MVSVWIWFGSVMTTLGILLSGVNNGDMMGHATVSSMVQRDSLALVALYNATGGRQWSNTWDLDQPISEWYGITLDSDGDVVALDLASNNLNGVVPQEIGFLIELKSLRLSQNRLTGNLPEEIGNLVKLEELVLFSNEMDQPFPDALTELSQIKFVSFAGNRITGEVPKAIGNMVSLEMLFLDQNRLTGTIPGSISSLAKLEVLDLHNNQLTGNIPGDIGDMDNLRELLLYDNRLSGTIPATIADMDSLQFCWLHNNQLEGAVPEFYKKVLRSIRLEHNDLNSLPDLTHLDLGPTSPDGLSVQNNKLSFDDIIINQPLDQKARFIYIPQDSIWRSGNFYANKGDRFQLNLPFDDTITTSRYKWFKDGNLFQLTDINVMVITNVQNVDAGEYYVEIDNDVIQNMTLTTHRFQLYVRDSASCDEPKAGDLCANAPLFCHSDDLDLYCGNLPPAFDTIGCSDLALSSETKWIGFTADSSATTIEILPFSCSNIDVGVQFAVFERCLGKTLILCEDTCVRDAITFELSDVIAGESYYLALRSCGGQCNYQIRAYSSGTPYRVELSGEISGPDTLCGPGQSTTFALSNRPAGINDFYWYLADDTLITSNPEVDLIFDSTGVTQLCVQAVSQCGSSNSICKDIVIFPGLFVTNLRTEVHQNNSFYNVEFKVQGGEGPIVIDGVGGVYNPVSRVFTSDLIPCGDTYNIQVSDKNNCRQILSGAGECNCLTEAGQLPFDLVETCGSQGVFAGPAAGYVSDSNDIETYVLLAENGYDPTGIVAIAADGIFSNALGNFTADVNYYVFHLVGNASANGGIDLFDPCLGVSNSRPIIFHSPPVAQAGRDTTYCESAFNLMAKKSKGQGLWTQVAGPSVAVIDKVGQATTVVITNEVGTYGFEWLESFKGCLSRDTVWIEVREQLEVEILGPDTLCTGQTGSLMTSEDYLAYIWDGGQRTRSIEIMGPGTYCVRVFSSEGCSRRVCFNVSSGTIDEPNIMGSSVLCPGDEEVIQVVPRYATYQWSTGDSIFFIRVNQPGTYCVTVTDFNGCTAEDCLDVVLFRDRTATVEDSICFGDTLAIFNEKLFQSGQFTLRRDDGEVCDTVVEVRLTVYDSIYISDSLVTRDDGSGNGAISVNIKGGRPPYSYLWSTGADIPFVHNLTAGIYTLVVTDQNACSVWFTFDLRNNTAVSNLYYTSKVTIGPNPVEAGAELKILLGEGDAGHQWRYEIISMSGVKQDFGIININNMSKSGFIPISQIMEGVYLLQISDLDNGIHGVYTLIVIP